MSYQLKVCCIQDVDEATLALKYGANLLGFVSAMPTGFRLLSDDQIKNIICDMGRSPGNQNVLLTSLKDAPSLIAQLKYTQADIVQIVDSVEIPVYDLIRKQLPKVSIMQVIHVNGPEAIERATTVDPYVDYVLLDSGKSSKKQQALGGTGQTHNWEISRDIVQAIRTPVFLAGGLHPANVESAIRAVEPYGVDICTGLRDPKYLVEAKLKELVSLLK